MPRGKTGVIVPKPCPFCGSTDLTWDFISCQIRCRICSAMGPKTRTMGRPEVAWNRRVVLSDEDKVDGGE